MKIICIKTQLESLELKEVLGKDGRPVDYSPINMHGLKVGGEYVVMGITIYRKVHCLYYLIDIDGRDPSWHPYSMFDIVDNAFPSDWFVKVFNQKEHTVLHAIWGFYELCNVNEFDLDFCEKEAIDIYFERKKDITLELYPELLEGYDPDNRLIILDYERLVMCDHCTHAWDIETNKKMLACPKCSKVYVNPFLFNCSK